MKGRLLSINIIRKYYLNPIKRVKYFQQVGQLQRVIIHVWEERLIPRCGETLEVCPLNIIKKLFPLPKANILSCSETI